MKNNERTKERFFRELIELRKRKSELELLENERNRTMEALRQSEERFRKLSEAAFEGIAISEKGVILDMNKTFANMFGYDISEMKGTHVSKLVSPEYRDDVIQKMMAGYENNYESLCVRKDGTRFPVEVCGKTIPYSDRTLRVTAIRDITERKKLEEEIMKTRKLESLGILAGGIAHDFNNLMSVILGSINLAKMDISHNSETFRRLTDAEKASLKAIGLVQQLITFSQGGDAVKKVCAMDELVRDSCTRALRDSHIEIEFSFPYKLWKVEADEVQMRQVLHNMVLNVREAMPEGGVVHVQAENVSVGSKDGLHLKAGKYVKIAIEDQGLGIPEENMQRLFEPYFTTKKMGNQKGMGLGLAICYAIVKNHDGLITVESDLGVGSTFHIYLPASDK